MTINLLRIYLSLYKFESKQLLLIYAFLDSTKYPVQEDRVVAPERTPCASRRDMQAALHQGEPSHGVKGPTPLMNAPGLNLGLGVNPEYLHCILEGVTKQMCDSRLTSTQLECYVDAPRTLETLQRAPALADVW